MPQAVRCARARTAPGRPDRRAAVVPNCRARTCHRRLHRKRLRPIARRHRRAPRSVVRGPDICQAFAPSASASSDDMNMRSAPKSSIMNRAVSRVILRANVFACGEPNAHTPEGVARCRRASSRSAAPPTTRRRCSGRIRPTAGRRCRHGPSPHVRSTASAGRMSPVRSWLRNNASSRAEGGNFGAPPKPPRAVSSSCSAAATAWSHSAGCTGGPPRQPRGHRPQFACDAIGGFFHLAAAATPGIGDRGQQLQEVGFRVVGATEERPPVRGEEAGHRPTTLSGRRGSRHVDRVEIRALLAVDLDADEPVVHGGGHLLVLERFVRHHVTPVARRISDGQQDRNVARRGFGQRFCRPLPPVHGIVGVLTQIRARRLDSVGRATARRRAANRDERC